MALRVSNTFTAPFSTLFGILDKAFDGFLFADSSRVRRYSPFRGPSRKISKEEVDRRTLEMVLFCFRCGLCAFLRYTCLCRSLSIRAHLALKDARYYAVYSSAISVRVWGVVAAPARSGTTRGLQALTGRLLPITNCSLRSHPPPTR